MKQAKRGETFHYIVIDGIEYEAKKCRNCKEIKQLKELVKNKHMKSGRETLCKECKAERARNYYQHNKEKVLAATKKWTSQNKEKVKQTSQKWYEDNKEKFDAYRKQYYVEHKEEEFKRMKLYSQKRRTLQMYLHYDFSSEIEKEIKQLYNFSCALTGKTENVQMEHFIPISWGHGGTYKENLYLLEGTLNVSKKDRNPFEWIKQKRIQKQIDLSKWNILIQRLASENGLTINEFEEFVYWCEQHKRDIHQLKKDRNKTSLEIWKEKIAL
jgi:hypothetical protein